MTYNVHSCVGVDGKLDVGRIAAVISQCRPDIVALQELDVGRARTGTVDQAHDIATKLGMSFHFHAAVKVEEEEYGDAILTTLPERLVRSGPLPTLPRMRGLEPRGALWVAMKVEGVELQVINTHLGLVPLEQRRQVAGLLGEDWLGNADFQDPAILLGDFNATSRYAVYRQLCGRLRDAQVSLPKRTRWWRTVPTFPSRAPMLRIDHMFVSKSIVVEAVHAPGGALCKTASDHLPLVADFHIAGAR
jgi:endonuclease/exonuclease/phosphatase family metal-dependent hydrolase